jgi:hypothetical protein
MRAVGQLRGALFGGADPVVELPRTVGEFARAVSGFHGLVVHGGETEEELVGRLGPGVSGDGLAHLAGDLVGDGADQVVVGVVGHDAQLRLAWFEPAWGEQCLREVLRYHQGEAVLAVGDSVVGLALAGAVPLEGSGLGELVEDFLPRLQRCSVFALGSGIVDDDGRGHRAEATVGVPVGVEVHRSVQQRNEGHRDQGESREPAGGEPAKFGQGKAKRRHQASSVVSCAVRSASVRCWFCELT